MSHSNVKNKSVIPTCIHVSNLELVVSLYSNDQNKSHGQDHCQGVIMVQEGEEIVCLDNNVV